MSPRRQGGTELTRNTILPVARTLFLEKGYRKVSMRQIAQELGCSHGVLYYHFHNKAELFATLVRSDFQLLNGRLNAAMQAKPSPGLNQLEWLMLELIRFGLTHKPQYEMMFMIDEPELHDYVEPIKLDSFQRFSAAVRKLTDPDGTEPPDYMLPWMLFISLHGFIAYYMQTESTFAEVQPLALRLVQHLYRGMS